MQAARELRCRILLIKVALALLSLPAAAPPLSADTNLVDINRATASELKTLPGIRDAWAQAIIRNRPYKSKTQLFTKKIVPFTAYKAIEDKIIAKQ